MHCARPGFLLVLALLGAAPVVRAQPVQQSTRILMLFSHDPNAPGVAAFTNELQRILREEGPAPLEVFDELLDFDRFRDPERWPKLAQYLAEKYKGLRFDLIVAEGSTALKFATERLSTLLPDVPIVYGLAFEPVVDFAAMPSNVTGRRQPLPFAETIAMARSLQPDAERVIVVGGASVTDSAVLATAMRDLAPRVGAMQLVVWQNWTYESLLAGLRRLPARTIVILSSFREDRAGQHFSSGDLIPSIARASSAPIYGIARTWLGDGIVGGGVMNFADDGMHTGRLVVRVLKRVKGEPMPAPEVAGSELVADWRELRRWELSERNLPAGTEVLFRTPTVWERYHTAILTAAAVLIAQSLLILLLLVERRKRKRAQRSVEESRGQVAHLARVATVGELTAAVSHELRQPLAAIRAHAEAGALLLALPVPDVGEAREIFQDIVNDNTRAAEVIDHIRMLLRKDTAGTTSVDINRVCRQASQLLQRDAVLRGVRLEQSLDARLPTVQGNAVQLQQVVLNLALNALDAVALSTRKREVVVGTAAHNGEVEIFVQDTGPGVPPEIHQHLFESFFSTKAHGLGMGLTIVQAIAEQHRGRVRAENAATGGAVFRVVLPSA